MRKRQRGSIKNDRGNASLVAGFLALIFVALVFRFAWHQVVPSAKVLKAAQSRGALPNWRKQTSLAEHAPRGVIYDRHGHPLARSWYEHVLVVNPHELSRGLSAQRAAELLRDLPRLLGDVDARLLDDWAKSERALERALFDSRRETEDGVQGTCRYRILTRGLLPDAYRHLSDRLREADLPGFSFDRCIKRIYSGGEACAQVVGIVGRNEKECSVAGRSGIEQALNDYLTGTRGQLNFVLDGDGQEMITGEAWESLPGAGAEVHLTIDAEIQRSAYEILKEHAAGHDTRATSAVVLSVQTGEILAICSYPSADPAHLEKGCGKQLNLPAAQHLYTPGSTIKPVLLSWAVDTEVISLSETFDCGGGAGWRRMGKRTVREYSPNPLPMSVSEIIMRSSNVGAVRICMERLGLEGMYAALNAFRVTQPTEIIFPAIPKPRYTRPTEAKWGYTSPMFPQGYELGVTPLSMARSYLTIARFGEQIEPTLVSKILTGDEILRPREIRSRVIGQRAAGVIGRAMKSVVEEPRGTGHRVRSDRWFIAAKTGTGQDEKNLGKPIYNAWFCSFAPATDPEIVVVVHTQIERRGRADYTGGRVSGPPAKAIIEKTLEYLQIPPDRPLDAGVTSSRER